MKYCSECGNRVVLEQRPGDATWRFVCNACRAAFYQTPKLSTACIADWEGRILLCRRGVEPEYGRWELPAGFVATGETVGSAAVRETLEEANAEIEIDRPYALLHVPHVNQLRVVYLARLLDNQLSVGPETIEVRLFDEHDIPWGDLAFATTRDTLHRYFADRREGDFGFFFAEIVPLPFG